MSFERKDYILRLIKELAQVIARLSGLKQQKKHDEALLLVRETSDAIFGPLRSIVESVDSISAAGLLGGGEKIVAYARLVAEEAAIHADRGDERRASAGRVRALELFLEATRVDAAIDEETRGVIEGLVVAVGEARLSERHTRALSRWRGSGPSL
jgi:hypothetical protein